MSLTLSHFLLLLSVISFIPSFHSKSINEYLHLSLGFERAAKILKTPTQRGDEVIFTEEEQEDTDPLISIGCGSYTNGGVAGQTPPPLPSPLSPPLTAIKYSTPNPYDLLISPYYVSLDEDAMCFLIYSLLPPDRQILTEFDVILPYPSLTKISGIYEEILNLWNHHEDSTDTAPVHAHSHLSLYLDSLLASPSLGVPAPPSSATDDDSIFFSSSSTPLSYGLYVSTFQFQYSPALMSSNVSSSLLASQSESLFTRVTSTLYDESTTSTQYQSPNKRSHHLQSLQLLRAETNTVDPCGYEQMDHSLHDVNEPTTPMLDLTSPPHMLPTEQYCHPNELSGCSQERVDSLHLPHQFALPLLHSNFGILDRTQSRVKPPSSACLMSLRVQTLNYRSRGIQECAKVGFSQDTSPYTSLSCLEPLLLNSLLLCLQVQDSLDQGWLSESPIRVSTRAREFLLIAIATEL
jgi:hypothetical protein